MSASPEQAVPGRPSAGGSMDLPARSARGFTLIEMMAVVVILMLVAGIVLPNLGLRAGAVARDEAISLGAALEMARQRSVATRCAHRVVFDLDRQVWWMEWRAPSDEPATAPAHWSELERIPLQPPRAEDRGFVPVASPHGRATGFHGDVVLVSVEIPGLLAEEGRVAIPFERDGTSAAARILLDDGTGRLLALEVAPLLDSVRIRHAND